MIRSSVFFLLLLNILSALHAQVRVPTPDITFPDAATGIQGNGTSAVIDGVIYFPWNDGVHGEELWRSDGTPTGTYMVKEALISPDLSMSHVRALAGHITFETWRRYGPNQIFVSDGTAAGTHLMYEGEREGTSYVIGDWAYFRLGETIYRANQGTSEKEVVAQTNDSFEMIATPTRLFYYDINTGTKGTDGTSTWDVNSAGYPSHALGETLIFTYDNTLALSDGTAGNYRVLREDLYTYDVLEADGTYFITGAGGGGPSLWKSEGTAETTEILDVGYPWEHNNLQIQMHEAPGGVFFWYEGGIYYTDGTPAGTTHLFQSRVTDNFNGLFPYGSTDTHAYFELRLDYNYHFYRTDGTNLELLESLRASRQEPFTPRANGLLFPINGDSLNFLNNSDLTYTNIDTKTTREVLDQAETSRGTFIGSAGHELWFFNKQGEATKISEVYTQGLETDGTQVYFKVGEEIWESDGTPAGTRDTGLQGTFYAFPNQFASYHNNTLTMRGETNVVDTRINGFTGTMLYQNGTLYHYSPSTTFQINMSIYRPGQEVETVRLDHPLSGDIKAVGDVYVDDQGTIFNPETVSTRQPFDFIQVMARLDDHIYFAFNSTFNGNSLYVSDGHTETTIYELDDTTPAINSLVRQTNDVYFAGTTDATGQELYHLDGNTPVLVKDINPGPAGSEISNLTPFGPHIYFTAYTPDRGFEIYNVGSGGTVFSLSDYLNPDGPSSHPRNLHFSRLGHGMFFEALENGAYKQIYMRDLIAGFETPADLCGTNEVTVQARERLDGVSYIWGIRNGSILSGRYEVDMTFRPDVPATEVEISLSISKDSNHIPTLSEWIDVVNNAPSQPNTITGPTSACASAQGLVWSIAAVPNASHYEWELPNGATILGPNDGTSITANFGAVAGDVRVRAHNSCGASPWQSLSVALTSDLLAYAGADANSCDSSVVLSANTAEGATGQWTILQGTGGSFNDASSPTASFSGEAGQTYILQWTLSHPTCGESSDSVRIHFEYGVPTANAGSDITACDNTVTLAANDSDTAFGVWQVLEGNGGSFADPQQPNTTFTGQPGTSYVLAWTLYAKPCGESVDTINLTLNNTLIANAGPDHQIAHNDGTQLCANGIGSWSVLSGPSSDIGQFDDPNDPFTYFRPSGGMGDYQLQWQLNAADCPQNSDTATVHALGAVPRPTFVTAHNPLEANHTEPANIRASLQVGDALYYVLAGQTYSLHKEEGGVNTHLGLMSESRTYDLRLFAVGTNLLVQGRYNYFYDAAKNQLRLLEGFNFNQAHQVVAYNNRFYFKSFIGSGIWESDGTPEGTREILNTGQLMGTWQGQLIFHAEGQIFAMTDSVADARSLTPGESYNHVNFLGTTQSAFYFATHTDGHDRIFVLKDDETGPRPLQIAPNNDFKPVTSFGDVVLFTIGNPDYDDTDYLWRSDGTPEGTFSFDVFIRQETQPHIHNGMLYFSSRNTTWQSDGSQLGTKIIWNTEADGLGSLNGLVYMSGNNQVTAYDGSTLTPVTTTQDTSIQRSNSSHLLLNRGHDIYRTNDITQEGELIHAPVIDAKMDPRTVHVIGQRVIFHHPSYRFASSDGTPEGTLNFFNEGELIALNRVVSNGTKAMFGTNGSPGRRLYITNGTAEKTKLINTSTDRGSAYRFEPYSSGHLVGYEGDGLYYYDGGTETEFYQRGVKGPFKDAYSDDFIYLSHTGNTLSIHRTNGTLADNEILLTISTFEELTEHQVRFIESHIYVYNSRQLYIINRADTSYTQHDLYTNLVDGQPRVHLLDDDLVYVANSIRRINSSGEVFDYGLDASPYSNLTQMGDKLVTATKDHIILISETQATTFDLVGYRSFGPTLTSLGDAVIFHAFSENRGWELYYFDEQGVRPMPEFVEGSDYAPIQAMAAHNNLGYILTEDGNARSAIYRLSVGGPSFADARLFNYILRLYDSNGDGYLDWEEAALITELDLRTGQFDNSRSSGPLGIQSLAGIEFLENLSRLYIGGNPIQDLTPIVDAGLGDDPDDVVDISNALLDDANCEDLALLQQRAADAGSSLSYEMQGGTVGTVKPEDWPQKTILGLIGEAMPPVYEWQCPQAKSPFQSNTRAEVQ